MAYSASAGILIATQTASTTFYPLTDHNRKPFSIGYETIEKVNRMADGTMRKYVVAKKKKVSVSWEMIPSGTSVPFNPTNVTPSATYQGMTMTVDGFKGGAWMKSFYEDNLFKPVVVKLIHSDDDWTQNTASAFYPSPRNPYYDTFTGFMTSFEYEVVKRLALTDMVNVKIEFTEI